MSDRSSPARFPTTRWSCIARAGVPASTEARRALAELCGAYWYPIYALIRRKGHDPDQALDLTQGYFARLLENGTVAAADPAKGRFRSFLFADCTFFLADQGDRDRALKRGGGRQIVTIDARDAEGRFIHEPAHVDTAERLYERDWALALIGRVFDRLQQHYAATKRSELFLCLKPLLTLEPDAASYETIAAEMGMNAGSLRVAAHRLRSRFALWLRDEVAATLDDPDDAAVDAELSDLFVVLGS